MFKTLIMNAISKGAPLYNQGDISSCLNIYKSTAEKLQFQLNEN